MTYSYGIKMRSMLKRYRKALFIMAAGLFLAATGASGLRAGAAGTVEVTADGQSGWLFNRDASTSSPYELNEDEASIGDGSLYVLPIGGADPSDKFIAEHFLDVPVEDFESISYDFFVDSNATANDYKQFYLNVYASLPDDLTTYPGYNGYYNCRYDYVPPSGVMGSFTTFDVDTLSIASNVNDRGGDRYICPGNWSDMVAGSTVNFISLSVGDTSANDAGVSGYYDNVVETIAGDTTIYDFDPDTTAPAVPTNLRRVVSTNPSQVLACGDVTTRQILYPTWDDNAEAADDFSHYEYNSFNNDTPGLTGEVLTTNQFEHSWTPPADGTFGFQVRSVDTNGNESGWSDICYITYDSVAPVVDITSHEDDDVVSGDVTVLGDITDDNLSHYRLNLRDANNPTTIVDFWIVNDDATPESAEVVFNSRNYADGMYILHLVGIDEAGNRGHDFVTVEIDNHADEKSECKTLWQNGLEAEGETEAMSFRNQGDCVSYFATMNSAVGQNPPQNGNGNDRNNRNRR